MERDSLKEKLRCLELLNKTPGTDSNENDNKEITHFNSDKAISQLKRALRFKEFELKRSNSSIKLMEKYQIHELFMKAAGYKVPKNEITERKKELLATATKDLLVLSCF